jgi:hypothetical protein
VLIYVFQRDSLSIRNNKQTAESEQQTARRFPRERLNASFVRVMFIFVSEHNSLRIRNNKQTEESDTNRRLVV